MALVGQARGLLSVCETPRSTQLAAPATDGDGRARRGGAIEGGSGARKGGAAG